MAITSEEAHASFKDFMKSESKELNEAKSILMSDTIGIEIDGFQFEVISKLTPAQVRLAADIGDDIKSYSDISNAFSKFMAAVSVHEAMRNQEFWLEYDNETGYLPDIVNYILENVERQAPLIKKFR